MTRRGEDGEDGLPVASLHRHLDDAVTANIEQVAALEQEHARIVASSSVSNADDEHDPEGATIAFEREQVTALLHRARHARTELEEALTRLDGGTYGRCEQCGAPIAPERLQARPDARTCIDCARRRRS